MPKPHTKLSLFLLLFIAILTSCTSQKQLAYFRKVQPESAAEINKHFVTAHEACIVNGDMLMITVTGLDPAAVAPFNMPIVAYSAPGSDAIYATPSVQSYLVDVNGEIDFPVIGKLKIAGLTKSETIKMLYGKLDPFLKNPIVNIKFLNYKITVMGEVVRPGQYTIDNERVTILDALGLAGDLTPYGKRDNVLITRENNGQLEFCRINLNNSDIFTSPYYYLQQNDVVYVEPNSVRAVASQNISLYLSMLTTLASLSTVLISILNK